MVSITPSTVSVALGATQQFSATVTGNANQNVTWGVDGIAGGNSTLGTISSSGLYVPPQMIGMHTITAIAQANSASQGTATVTVGSLVPLSNTFFGMHLLSLSSPIPSTMAGTARVWDSASAQWPNINTASGMFVWDDLDTLLADYHAAGIDDVFYTLWRVPTWASSMPADATCDYAAQGHAYYGECDLPKDIAADGTGTDLTWRTWVQNIAQHANGQDPNNPDPNYLSNHAHISYWEPCNECFRSPTLDPGYGSNGAQVAYRGTYAQLVRMMQDARCIIIGTPTDPITALRRASIAGRLDIHIRKSIRGENGDAFHWPTADDGWQNGSLHPGHAESPLLHLRRQLMFSEHDRLPHRPGWQWGGRYHFSSYLSQELHAGADSNRGS